MRSIFFLLLTMQAFSLMAQSSNPSYDSALAKKLGGDDYGMKSYYLVILKSGSNKVTDKKLSDTLFRGHMNNINQLAAENKLVVAGPLGKNDKNYRGIFIFNATTAEEVAALLLKDPAIQAKVFDTEVYQWYGSAALPEYIISHKKIEKLKP